MVQFLKQSSYWKIILNGNVVISKVDAKQGKKPCAL